MVTSRVHFVADGNHLWEDFDRPSAEVLEEWVTCDPSRTEVQIVDLTTGATVWSTEDAYFVARPPETVASARQLAAARSVPVTPRLRLPPVMTCLRLAIALFWLIGLIAHLKGGGTHPCTCHP